MPTPAGSPASPLRIDLARHVGVELGRSATSSVSLNESAVRALAGKASGPIRLSDLWNKSSFSRSFSAMIGFGNSISGGYSMVNNMLRVLNTGVFGSETSGVGTARFHAAGSEYGTTRGIFFGGTSSGTGAFNMTNLVSDTGVLNSDTSTVGSVRKYHSGCPYGTDRSIFAYGWFSSTYATVSNQVSNTGILASDVSLVGTQRQNSSGAGYGGDRGVYIFGYQNVRAGTAPLVINTANYVTNTGVIGGNVGTSGTIRDFVTATEYGNGNCSFAYGNTIYTIVNTICRVTNTGSISGDITGAGSARRTPAGITFNGDRGMYAFGAAGGGFDPLSVYNTISNTGAVSGDIASGKTRRSWPGGVSYG